MIKKEETKLIVVDGKGSIKELGGISAPIINPIRLEISKIAQMILAHRKVYEVNPENKNDRIKLTLQNVRRVNFKPTSVKKTTNVVPTLNSNSSVQNVVPTPEKVLTTTTEKTDDIEIKDYDSKPNDNNKKNRKNDFSKK